jgi:hypothetical protein
MDRVGYTIARAADLIDAAGYIPPYISRRNNDMGSDQRGYTLYGALNMACHSMSLFKIDCINCGLARDCLRTYLENEKDFSHYMQQDSGFRLDWWEEDHPNQVVTYLRKACK